MDVSGTSGSDVPSWRLTIERSSSTMPSASCSVIDSISRRACASRAMASDAGSSALSTAQSAADWFSKIRALAAAYSSTVAWRSRWSGEKFSNTAIQGWKVSIPSSWKLLASTT